MMKKGKWEPSDERWIGFPERPTCENSPIHTQRKKGTHALGSDPELLPNRSKEGGLLIESLAPHLPHPEEFVLEGTQKPLA